MFDLPIPKTSFIVGLLGFLFSFGFSVSVNFRAAVLLFFLTLLACKLYTVRLCLSAYNNYFCIVWCVLLHTLHHVGIIYLIVYVVYVRLLQKQRLSDHNSFTKSCMRLHA